MTASRGFAVGVSCVLLIVAVATASFAIGRSSRTSAQGAALAGASARSSAYAAAVRTGAARGRATGDARGLIKGRAAGVNNGSRAGNAAAAKLVAAASKQEAVSATVSGSSGSCPAGLVPQGTEACVVPGTASVGGESAGCGGDPYSTPDRYGGCIGPAAPPSAANSGPATNCPAGEVPVGTAGACAPSSGSEP
jgi:hypothetical protein